MGLRGAVHQQWSLFLLAVHHGGLNEDGKYEQPPARPSVPFPLPRFSVPPLRSKSRNPAIPTPFCNFLGDGPRSEVTTDSSPISISGNGDNLLIIFVTQRASLSHWGQSTCRRFRRAAGISVVARLLASEIHLYAIVFQTNVGLFSRRRIFWGS
jgi:hypothetical protein